MSCYQCPLCSAPLLQDNDAKGYSCSQRHHFDVAKEGYLHLLPVQHKHSKLPGDSKAMLQARRQFLQAGYYQPLVMALVALIKQHAVTSQACSLLDLGCGEGFYARQLAQQCADIQIYGVDIAKLAVAMAAKQQPHAQFAVASNQRLPYVPHSFDWVLRVFAPSNVNEIQRVLKPQGFLLTVTPGPRHLWQLKAFVYDDVHTHPLSTTLPEPLTILAQQQCCFTIMPGPQDREALLQMTPFAWHARPDTQQRLLAAAEMPIEADFIITLARYLA